MKALFPALHVIMTLSLLANCESRDLGDKAPAAIAMANANWEGGVEALILKKCANCHTTNRSEFVPRNTPNSLDAMATKAFWEDASNLAALNTIKARLVDTEKPMPPTFATPFVGEEKQLFETFIDNQIKQIGLVTPPPPPKPEPKCQTLPDWNEDIAAALKLNCANGNCHAAEGKAQPKLTNEMSWLLHRENARKLIQVGSMPKGNREFANSKDGQLLLGTLCIESPEPEKPVEQSLVLKVSVKHLLADGSNADDRKVMTFSEVKPLLDRTCTGCHGPFTENDPSEYDLLDLSQRPLLSKREDSDGVIRLDSERKIVEEVLYLIDLPMDDFLRMPQFSSDPKDMELDAALKNWLANGLPDEAPAQPLDQLSGIFCKSSVTTNGVTTANDWVSLTKSSFRNFSGAFRALPNADVTITCKAEGVMPKGNWSHTSTSFKVTPDIQVPVLEMVFHEVGI